MQGPVAVSPVLVVRLEGPGKVTLEEKLANLPEYTVVDFH